MTARPRRSTRGDLATPATCGLASINPAAPFSPVIVNPGQTATIDVTITPSGAAGTVVQGNLYVDDFVSGVPPYGQETGNEVSSIPYEYTVG